MLSTKYQMLNNTKALVSKIQNKKVLVFEFRDLNLLRAWNLEFRIPPKELDG